MDQVPDLTSSKSGPKVVVVGPCASGKSTLVRNLHKKGINAFVAGQEHSAIRNLWAKRDPDIIVALDVDLETLRKRRGDSWPSKLYRVQHERLSDAFAAATTIIDTSRVPEEEVAARVAAIVTNFQRGDVSSTETSLPDTGPEIQPRRPGP